MTSSKRSIGCSLSPRLAHRPVDIHRPPPPSAIGPLPTKEKRVASSHSAHEAPLIQIHQYSGACVTSSPPPLMIVAMMVVIVPLMISCSLSPPREGHQVGSLPRRGMITTTITTSTITTICDRENGGGERESETSPDPDPTQSRPDPDHTCSSLNALG